MSHYNYNNIIDFVYMIGKKKWQPLWVATCEYVEN